MKNNIPYKKFRLDRASDLLKLQNALKKHAVCRNPEKISSAIEELRKMNDTNNKELWGYSISGMFFDMIEGSRNCNPNTATNISLEFNIEIKGTIDNCFKIKDPFTKLDFNIIIHGRESNQSDLICSYHLDRHIENDGGNEESTHPLYHFHFGGRGMSNNNYSFGNLILLESPRFAHYPMELILGVDFILANYFHDKWQKLLCEDGEYLNLIKSYRNFFWKPYVRTLNRVWQNDDTTIEWDPILLWPQLKNHAS